MAIKNNSTRSPVTIYNECVRAYLLGNVCAVTWEKFKCTRTKRESVMGDRSGFIVHTYADAEGRGERILCVTYLASALRSREIA